MPEYLETTFDKFIFRVATDRLYSREGLWASAEGGKVRIGLSDYLQQRSGDVAFAEVKPVGTTVSAGDDLATIETIKVNLVLPSPATGTVLEVNPTTATAPEMVNQDPYGQGWLALIEPAAWAKDQVRLLGPQAYLEVIRREAEEEAKKP